MYTTHSHVLITGPGGSRKTTLATHFKHRDKNAIDADLAGVGAWLDLNGMEKEVPVDQDLRKINQWAEENGLSWYWDRQKLSKLLNGFDEVFLMESARNVFELLDIFDRVFYLVADEKLILKRLEERTRGGENYHDNGATDQQREEIIGKIGPKLEEAKVRGFELIDASLTPDQIFDLITEE